MKQALLITAYKDFDHLIDLVLSLDDKLLVYVHVDKKTTIPKEAYKTLNRLSHVVLISQKYRVCWGGRTHLEAIIHLSSEALKSKEIERFHLISGNDYPIKDFNFFNNFFQQNKDINYISHYPLPIEQWPNGGIDRYLYYNFYDLIDAKINRGLIFKLVEIQKKIGIKRRLHKLGLDLYGGDTWWSLNREALEYVVNYTNKKPNFFRRMRFTFCSEEIYFQTLIMNSHFASKTKNNSLRYIDWTDRNGNFPANLDASDYIKMKKSDKIFARKFENTISEKLKIMINKEILQKKAF